MSKKVHASPSKW